MDEGSLMVLTSLENTVVSNHCVLSILLNFSFGKITLNHYDDALPE